MKNTRLQLSYLVAPWRILHHPLPCRCQQFFPAVEIHTGIVLVAHPVILQTTEQDPRAMAYSGMHPEKKQNILRRIQRKLSQRTLPESDSYTFNHLHNTSFELPYKLCIDSFPKVHVVADSGRFPLGGNHGTCIDENTNI